MKENKEKIEKKKKVFIPNIPYCVKCEEPLIKMKVLTDYNPGFFHDRYFWKTIYYCDNEKCPHRGVLTMLRIMTENK